MSTTTTTSSQSQENSSGGSETNNNAAADVNNGESGTFECNICLEGAAQPVITLCGHLYCWPCIYRWTQMHLSNPLCPVCKSSITTDSLIPLYGRGKEQTDPRTRIPEIPSRPNARHSDPVHQPHQEFGSYNLPGNFGGFSFSAGVGIFPTLFGLQFHTFPNSVNRNGGYLNQDQDNPQGLLSRMLFMLAMLVLFFLLFF
eukprot:TRINITY_DN4322_c0_g2_i3.p1 TRINITY_DN4322_c0_g2~~TRINITY_DN4322_c0_g2_i3.p1  ORF type:complete len:200 (-),score=38.58 TRINITY_DN4322_c0_g2_i3:185-784(-)